MNPDVVLMDIGLPGMSGIQCVSELKRTNPALQIIMVTIYEDSERIFKALRAGASGYLLKSGPPSQLLDSVRDVFAGGMPMSSHIARNMVEHFHLLGPLPPKAKALSDREQQALDLLASGFIYREIGDQLDTHAKPLSSAWQSERILVRTSLPFRADVGVCIR